MINFIKVITRPFRRKIMSWAHKIRLHFDVLECRRNYAVQLAKCQEKYARHEKIKVMFLVSELAKWKTQPLYDELDDSKFFEPFLAISCMGEWWKHPEYEVLVKDMVSAFSQKNMKYVVVADFKTMRNIPLSTFKPDIVFYEQPYDWKREYMPVSISRFALTLYVPYYVPTNEINEKWYDGAFLHTLFLYIQLNQKLVDCLAPYIANSAYAGTIEGLGHTFYDAYLSQAPGNRCADNDLVIYAPHWTFDHPQNINDHNFSTFLWNGKEILEFAKKHPEVKWVFKPHPRLQWQLVRSNVWTQDEVDEYYDEWSKVGTNYFGSDYIELFKHSRVLITDCSSFIGEYPPCGGALIHLLSSTQKTTLLSAYGKMFASFYQVHDLREMYDVFDAVILRREDSKREERIKAVRELNLVGNNAAKNIVDYLLDRFSTHK